MIGRQHTLDVMGVFKTPYTCSQEETPSTGPAVLNIILRINWGMVSNTTDTMRQSTT